MSCLQSLHRECQSEVSWEDSFPYREKIALATETGVSATHVQAGLFGLLTHNTVLLRQSVHMCKSSAYSNAADDASMRKACKSQNILCLICCTMSYALCTARLLWAE